MPKLKIIRRPILWLVIKKYNYLIELENNNNRDWYHENKELRIEVNKEFENIIQELINQIGIFDSSILDLTFVILNQKI